MPEPPREAHPDDLHDALVTVAVALKESGLPFALTGGYAAWVHGAPEAGHDIDFLVAEDDQEAAAAALEGRGLRVRRPSEDWLFKVDLDPATVDVLFRAAGDVPVRDMIERAEETSVLSVLLPVATATDVVAEKLTVLDEHYCDLSQVLPVVRALREQVDWDECRRRTRDNDFAAATLFLLERLGIVDPVL